MSDIRMTDLPHTEALAVLNGDLDDFLPRRVRDILLNLILAWAKFDTAIAFLAASASGLNPDEGADKYGRSQLGQKLTATAKALREMGDHENAAIVDRLKEASPSFAKLRNRVAMLVVSVCGDLSLARLSFCHMRKKGRLGIWRSRFMISLSSWPQLSLLIRRTLC